MTRVLLVRHGQTVWNKTIRYQGHSDVELSPAGYQQAELLSQKLSGIEIDAVYASDLQRAWKTAKILATPHHLPVERVKNLREVHFGRWEGLTYQEISDRYPDLAEQWYRSPGSVRIPDGETFTEVKDRSWRALLQLVDKDEPGTILVVTHGGTIRTIICACLGLDLNHAFQINQDNTALNIIDFYDGEGFIKLLNDTGHLGVLGADTVVYRQ